MTERRAIAWSPKWEGPVRNWAISYLRQQAWRCDSIHDLDDLIQDAFLVFDKVKNAYPRVIEPAHFMSLFKTALRNHITDKARYVQIKRVCHIETASDVSEFYGGVGEVTNEGLLRVALAEAPEEVRAALDILTNRPYALRRTSKRRRRYNLNAKLRRLAGIEGKFDITGTLKQILS